MYFVLRGSGSFINGARAEEFQPGDAIFVPAGVVHRFDRFSEDFATWVVFWGPEGGEAKNRGPKTPTRARRGSSGRRATVSCISHGTMTMRYLQTKSVGTGGRGPTIVATVSGTTQVGDKAAEPLPLVMVTAGAEGAVSVSESGGAWVVGLG